MCVSAVKGIFGGRGDYGGISWDCWERPGTL